MKVAFYYFYCFFAVSITGGGVVAIIESTANLPSRLLLWSIIWTPIFFKSWKKFKSSKVPHAVTWESGDYFRLLNARLSSTYSSNDISLLIQNDEFRTTLDKYVSAYGLALEGEAFEFLRLSVSEITPVYGGAKLYGNSIIPSDLLEAFILYTHYEKVFDLCFKSISQQPDYKQQLTAIAEYNVKNNIEFSKYVISRLLLAFQFDPEYGFEAHTSDKIKRKIIRSSSPNNIRADYEAIFHAKKLKLFNDGLENSEAIKDFDKKVRLDTVSSAIQNLFSGQISFQPTDYHIVGNDFSRDSMCWFTANWSFSISV